MSSARKVLSLLEGMSEDVTVIKSDEFGAISYRFISGDPGDWINLLKRALPPRVDVFIDGNDLMVRLLKQNLSSLILKKLENFEQMNNWKVKWSKSYAPAAAPSRDRYSDNFYDF